MTRPFVTFTTSDAFPVAGTPPGRGLADMASAALEHAGLPHDRPEELGDWGWELIVKEPRGSAGCTLQRDRPHDRWVIDLFSRPRMRVGSSARREAAEAAQQLLAAWAGAIHVVLVAHRDVQDVRWWHAADVDAGAVWADRPDA